MTEEVKIYTVIRVVKEEYEVHAISERDALYKIQSPHTITVIKETIKESHSKPAHRSATPYVQKKRTRR